MSDARPQLWVVAGPNGAGKTTLVTHRVEGRLPVINPDVIAQGLPRRRGGGLDERGAGAIALCERATLLSEAVSFAVETTLAGHSTLRFMSEAQSRGFKTTLVYVGLRDAELALGRVLNRVGLGGHVVPVSAILRRFPASLANLPVAMTLAERTFVLDNSGERRRLVLVQEGQQRRFVARDLPAWLTGALPPVLR